MCTELTASCVLCPMPMSASHVDRADDKLVTKAISRITFILNTLPTQYYKIHVLDHEFTIDKALRPILYRH